MSVLTACTANINGNYCLLYEPVYADYEHDTPETIRQIDRNNIIYINWVFKPHPRFKAAVVCNNIMSEDEINTYYRQWENLGTIYDSGDYIQLFADSDALITDCVSFLGEYLPSKNPILHLISPAAKFNNFAKSFIDSLYQIYDISDLEEIFKKVIFENQDIKKEERLSKIHILFDSEISSASKIIKFLTNSLELKK